MPHAGAGRRGPRCGGFLFWLSLIVAPPALAAADEVERGRYLLQAAGCAGCHTDRDHDGEALAGGRALATPFGTFYSSNITPDPDTGIGRWTDAQFLRALKGGIAPDGSLYYPAFPYTAYARMTREDVLAIKAYLFSIAPVRRRNRNHDLPWYLGWSPPLWLWRALNFDSRPLPPVGGAQLQRGAYLAEALAHCGECHTPRGALGGMLTRRQYAGTRSGPEGKTIPNITPHRETGIGRWSRDDLVFYFQLGMTPGGDSAGGLMAEVIDNGLSRLTAADQNALAAYVLSRAPVANPLQREAKKASRRGEFD